MHECSGNVQRTADIHRRSFAVRRQRYAVYRVLRIQLQHATHLLAQFFPGRIQVMIGVAGLLLVLVHRLRVSGCADAAGRVKIRRQQRAYRVRLTLQRRDFKIAVKAIDMIVRQLAPADEILPAASGNQKKEQYFSHLSVHPDIS